MSTLSPRARKALAAASLALGAPILAGPITATAATPVVNQAPLPLDSTGAPSTYGPGSPPGYTSYERTSDCSCGYFVAGMKPDGPVLTLEPGAATPQWVDGVFNKYAFSAPVIQLPDVYIAEEDSFDANPYDPRAFAPNDWPGLQDLQVVHLCTGVTSSFSGLHGHQVIETSSSLPPSVVDYDTDGVLRIPAGQWGSTLVSRSVAYSQYASGNVIIADCLPGGAHYIDQLRGCAAEIVQNIVILRRSVATNDTATTPLDTPVTIAINANDAPQPHAGATTSLTTQPGHGVVVLHADGTATYTPTAGFSGTDTFTYTINDTVTKKSSTATVTVTVQAPPAPPSSPTPAPTTPAPAPIVAGTPSTPAEPSAVLSNTGSPVSAPWFLAAAASTGIGAWLLGRRRRA